MQLHAIRVMMIMMLMMKLISSPTPAIGSRTMNAMSVAEGFPDLLPCAVLIMACWCHRLSHRQLTSTQQLVKLQANGIVHSGSKPAKVAKLVALLAAASADQKTMPKQYHSMAGKVWPGQGRPGCRGASIRGLCTADPTGGSRPTPAGGRGPSSSCWPCSSAGR